MNPTEWAHAQGICGTTAYRWRGEGTLPVPARKAGERILVSPDAAASSAWQDAAGLYAWVSSHEQKADLGRQVADGRRLVAVDDGEVTDDLVRDVIEVTAWFCARRCGRRPAGNWALKTVGCARRGIGPRAVAGAGRCGGAG